MRSNDLFGRTNQRDPALSAIRWIASLAIFLLFFGSLLSLPVN